MDNVTNLIKYAWGILDSHGNTVIAISTTLYFISTILILNENKKSNLGKYMPIITINYNSRLRQFEATNIGDGLATNITIETYHSLLTDIKKHYKLDFNRIYNLKPNQTHPLSYNINGVARSNSMLGDFLRLNDKDLIFILSAKDVFGNEYYEHVNFGKSGIFIRKLRKVNYINKLYFYCKERILLAFEYSKYIVRGKTNSSLLL